MSLGNAIDWVGKVVDAAGVIAIVAGALYATGLYAVRWRRKPPNAQYRAYR